MKVKVLLALALIVVLCGCTSKSNSISNDTDSDGYDSYIATLEEENEELALRNFELEDKLAEVENDSLRASDALLLQENIYFLPDDGERTFHRYGCEYLNMSVPHIIIDGFEGSPEDYTYPDGTCPDPCGECCW